MDSRTTKIACLLKEIIDSKNEVPSALSDYVLQEYGLVEKSKDSIPEDEIDEIVNLIEEAIENKYKKFDEGTRRSDNNKRVPKVTEARSDFIKACESFSSSVSNYVHLNFELLALLKDIAQFKQQYSEHVKDESLAKQSEIEILTKRMTYLKLQCFHKLYTEKNSVEAHLELRKILAAQLTKLKSQYKKLVTMDENYMELKGNKTYCDLLQTYRELLEKDNKIDYMFEDM